MGWVRINPRYREALRQHGLALAADFLRLPGVILSGHPDRHVLRVDLPFSLSSDSECPSPLYSGERGWGQRVAAAGFLKKEHRVPWRDRLANAWAGFGFVSKSAREAIILGKLAQAGVPCPEVLAVGEHRRQAFLLLREQAEGTELRHYLQHYSGECLAVAQALGQSLARIHAAGFRHGDLYTKHILVGPGSRFCFLDWQRAQHKRQTPWAWRCRDLATLDATMPESLADNSVRRAFLRSYVRGLRGPSLKTCLRDVRRSSSKLQQKPRIRAMRRLPLPPGTQSLVWLDGEALCVTRAFREELGGQIPSWLHFRAMTPNVVDCRQVSLGTGRVGTLARRSVRSFRGWLQSWWRRLPAPEVAEAALLFRLERHNVACPKLLAFGQRRARPWHRYSFILTESSPVASDLASALAALASPAGRGRLLRHAGGLLRQVHEAGYILGMHAAEFAAMCAVSNEANLRLALARIDGLERKDRVWSELALLDLPRLEAVHGLRATEALRFFLGYIGAPRLTASGRALARKAGLKREVAQ